MSDNDRTQNELARERTHASWIRTSLTFLVTLIAVRHYATGGEWPVTFMLAAGGAVSAVRAAMLAPDAVSRITAHTLIGVALCALLLNI